MVRPTYLIAIYILSLMILSACLPPARGNLDEGPSPARSPAEELSTFQLEPGFQIQLVAAEPMVEDPVVITFDEDGRLWAVEMRGFMPTIDGDGEETPVGRVSVLEDTNGDGQMDKSTIYLDSLIMPRALAVVGNGALVAENKSLWMTQDLDGDLKADTKVLVDSDYASNGLPEHSDNGLWRGVDNWFYNAKSHFRYKMVDGAWQRDSTEFRGQWGLSHDDKGRLHYNYNWSQLHADLVPPNYLSRNANHTPTTGIDQGLTLDRRIYPIRDNPAVNRGYIPGTLNEEGKLLEFTAACSPLVYRGVALTEFKGNVFVCEPAGNLIKRNVVKENGLQITAYDPHPGTEFLASTDERFRPVHLASGPDGALYVADMYRGIVQHGAYMTPYLREQTLSRKLVLPINRGRIWRIVPDNWKATKPVKLSTLSSAELLSYLSHADGWYRDVAQRLLVERQDASIVPALANLAQKGDSDLGRFHALWTLEGLNAKDSDLLFTLINDNNSLVATTALRLLEPMAKKDRQVRTQLEKELLSIQQQASDEQALQTALTAGILKPDVAQQLLVGIITRYDTSALMRDAVLSSLQDQEYQFLQKISNSPTWQAHSPAKEIFTEMLTSTIVHKRDPDEISALLSALDIPASSSGWQEKAIATGLAVQGMQGKIKPIKLVSAPTVLTQPSQLIDKSSQQAIAALFEWPGHTAETGGMAQVNPLNEEGQKQFVLGRQNYLSTCAGCHGTDGAGVKRFAPPLIKSDWVLGNQKRLALLILHGMEGPVRVSGINYDAPEILPVMPAHSTLDDAQIAAILTYIRNAWGNQADPVSRGLVGSTRHTSQGRVVPWTAGELNQHILETQVPTGQ